MATPTASTTTPQRSVPHTGASGLMAYDSPAVLHMLSEGGVGMGISMSGLGMSQLGLTASAMGRADEAERTRRLHAILDTLKTKPGRVSEDGLLALCRRLGIPWEKTNEAGGYVLLLGDEAMCDIVFHNDQIAKVDLQTGLDGEQPDLRFGQMGSQILVRSLKPLAGQTNINVTLDRFAENLDKLLTLDKLGAPSNGGVSCYNAIAGVYTSLRRLFEHEKNMALTLIDANASNRTHKAERDVMCKKSGRPRLNGGSCLGLSLEYWMDRRHLIPQTDKSNKMDVDGEDDYPEDDDPETNKMYSLTLECEASPSTLFTPIRISNEWLSEAIEKPADANDANASIDNILLNTPSIDWLDPKPTYLETPAPTGEHDGLNLDSAPGRLPNIRFVARFNPPLVVPLAVYMQLYQSVGLEPRPEDFRPTTFVGLAVRPDELDPGMLGTAGESTHEVRSARDVVVVDATGQQKDVRHNMSLYVPKMEYSRTLESLPFAHPKQIVEILPVLRQYACTTSLIRGSFVDTTDTSTNDTASTKLTPRDAKPHAAPLQLDINLSYTPPAPRITLHTPHPSSTHPSLSPTTTTTDPDISSLLASLLAPTTPSSPQPSKTHAPLSVTLDVHPNAEIVVAEQNILPVPEIPGAGGEKLDLGGSAASGGDAKDGDAGKSGDGDDVNGNGEAEGNANADADGNQGTSADVAMAAAQRREERVKRLVRALDVCGDLGVWGEWLRREVRGLEAEGK